MASDTERSTRMPAAATGSPGWIASLGGPTAGIAIATLLLFAICIVVAPQSLSSGALSGTVPFAAILALVALGQTLVIQQGGIDLSVPGVVSLSAVIVCYFANGGPGGSPDLVPALALAFGAAALAGLISGILVSRVSVAPIVATIGMNALLYGVNISISGGTPVAIPLEISAFVNAKLFGLSLLAYLALAVAVVLIFIIKATSFGRVFEAVGANERAARAAGIATARYKTAAYIGAALLYAAGGIFLGGLMQLPSPQQGDNYLMPSIAAAVLGGTSLFGGRGNLAATVIAAIFLTQLQQLVLTTGASVGVQYLFQGAAILIGLGVYGVKFKDLSRLFRVRNRSYC
ncbi:ABC transporter permease [Microbaculum marinum]|uniref:ABC transporter permease n=1 Tax=Microbaculum marinum TaxID=1764581 RepID=A0AAW9RAR1_9HYPH